MALRNWTPDEKLMALMRLPWTLRTERDDTDGSLVLQVEEVPDAIATGASLKELAKDLWESLSASLRIRLAHGDPVPLPKGSALPWEVEKAGKMDVVELQIAQPIGPITVRPRATAAA